jgi:excisionase family DNA binding protein
MPKASLEYEPLVTRAEFAGALRVNAQTVTRWADKGDIRSVRTPGGWRRFYQSDLDAILRGEQPERGESR